MIVSVRNTQAFAAALLGSFVLAGGAGAGDMSGGGSSPSACCTGGMVGTVRTPDIRIGGPSVSVGTPHVQGHHSSFTVNGSYGYAVKDRFIGRGAGGSIVAVGGGFIEGGSARSTSSLNGLNVVADVTETISEKVPVTTTAAVERSRTVERRVKVSAVCLDDTGAPHPASRPSPDTEVAAHYAGELFRCVAGTAMQVTATPLDADAEDYAHARTLMCAKGEALRHAPGGELACATQEPRRNCNERSLLRKFGPGHKVLAMRLTETYVAHEEQTTYQHVTRNVTRTVAHAGGPIVFDGGVGAACLGC